MDTFIQALGIVAAICIGTFVLTLFFKLVGAFTRLINKASYKLFKTLSFLPENSVVDLYLADDRLFEQVRFIGYVRSRTDANDPVPHELNRMLVFETPEGCKLYIRPDSIHVIKERTAVV